MGLRPGTARRVFLVPRPGRSSVPGLAWEPPGGGPGRALVLIGHGGSSHKAGARVVRVAERLAVAHGIEVVAIDGPFHGDRAPSPGVDYQEAIVARGVDRVTEEVVDDWLSALDHLGWPRQEPPVGLGYLGMSMGTRFGLALAARLGTRLDAAVLGKFSLRSTGSIHPGLASPRRTASYAERVRCPVLFHLEEHDEVFDPAAQQELFDRLGSREKTLLRRDGRHGDARPADETAWIDFLLTHLRRQD